MPGSCENAHGVVFEYEVPLDYLDCVDPHDLIIDSYDGRILCFYEDGGQQSVGIIHVDVINTDTCLDPVDAADSLNSDVYEAAATFLQDHDGPNVGGWKNEELFWDLCTPGLVYIDCVDIEEKHRGFDLGLRAVAQVLVRLGKDKGLAVLKPWPVNMAMKDPGFQKARQALGRHWSKLGFSWYRDSDYMYLRLDTANYAFDEILGYPFG